MATKSEVIYGKNTVDEAFASSREIFEVFVSEALYNKDKRLVGQIKKDRIKCHTIPNKKFDQYVKETYGVKGNHQGIVAVVAPYEYMPLREMLDKATSKKNEPAFIVVLDGLEDPHNLGAILRTADAAGVDGIVIRKDRAVGLSQTVAKLSTGAIEHVPVASVTNLTTALNAMKDAGLWVVGTDASEATDYRTVDGKLPLALVIGSEGKGMSRLVREACDFKVFLPMRGHVTSLNASVAAALLIYEVYNQRNKL
ncbi:MAG: 23S rRNA (guanosine(2251)-2'-O)-methyltransferase RlmB [Turicibacter sp.]|nr:23S rRNA (guanosine(2251)-2'-O)-methyltransferase RlmB [Turicibacter sp.]